MKVVNLKDYPRDRTKYIGRGSSLGNPFTHLPLAQTKAYVQCDTVETAVGCYEAWMRGSTAWDGTISPGLRNRALQTLDRLREGDLLGCYCADPARCHGQVIVKLWEERNGATGAERG